MREEQQENAKDQTKGKTFIYEEFESINACKREKNYYSKIKP